MSVISSSVIRIASLSAAVVVLFAGHPVTAQDQPVKDPPPAEEKVAEQPVTDKPDQPKDDDEPTLDELLGIEGEAAPTEGLPDIERALEGGAGEAQQDISQLFVSAVESMSRSADRLGDLGDHGLTTQRFQEDALNKLDMLIAMAQQNQQQQQPSPQSQQQQSDPQAQQQQQQQAGSGENPGVDSRPPARQAELDGDISESRAEWGMLPARLRDMLLQGRGDTAASLYRRLTERYYQRLAEEEEGNRP